MQRLLPLALALCLAACGDESAAPDNAQRWEGADGSHYRGQMQDGRLQGLGVLERADGSRHEGYFANGQADGLGVRIEASGERLAGRFEQGLLQGEGRYESPEGDRYDGGFRDDQFDGTGRYQSADGERWSGTFAAGQLRQGEHQDLDGNRYQGEFADWQYAGQGDLQRADGSRYQGGFRAGRFDGAGVLTRADGRREAGLWRDGRRWQDEHGERLTDPLELALLDQGRLLDAQLQALPPSTPATELYALTLAGDGRQSVFLREADYVADLLRTRFAARGVVSLVNHREHLDDRPLATRESLARAIQALAERSGPEDLIFLYLTSHGGHDHTLSLAQPGLALLDLDARELPQLLAPLAKRRKILVISACYSGGFIPAVKDDNTLVMTAASADRVSFGCSEEADFTYFGRALFAEALQQTGDLAEAYRLASARIAEREQAQGFEASQPQLWAPDNVLQAWNAYRRQLPTR